MNINTPYAQLEPDLILDAVEHLGFSCSGTLLPLNSFENRVYQIGIEENPPVIAKFYRPARWRDEAILEEHQFALELNNHEIPIVAPLIINEQTLHTYKEFRFALFPRRSGRALEIGNIEQMEWIGRFIGRLHAIGATHAFHDRLTLNVQNYGYHPYHYLIEHDFIPADIKSQYQDTIQLLLADIEQYFSRMDNINIIRLHGDCHAGNVLWNDFGPTIVDLDDCLMGPAIQDLWMLLPGTTSLEFSAQLHQLIKGYREFHDFDMREIHLIEALRALRMIHYSGWLAKRWEDPAFPLNFPWFNTERYWQEQLHLLKEQNDLLVTNLG